MDLKTLIFSNKTLFKIARHGLFWIFYCTYFYIQSIDPAKFEDFANKDIYYNAFLSLCCFAPVFVIAVYLFIYVLIPKCLKPKKYFLFTGYYVGIYVLGLLINYITADIFFRLVRYSTVPPISFANKMLLGGANTRWAMVIATLALGIKFSKDWYLQQKETLANLKRKNAGEMKAKKAKLQPEMLFRSLDAIRENIRLDSGKSPAMILNLSDILSYSLYESESKLVRLTEELEQLQQFILLEQSNKENMLRIEWLITGSPENKYIVPMLLIELLAEEIDIIHRKQHFPSGIKLKINVNDENLTMNFFSTPSEKRLERIFPLYKEVSFPTVNTKVVVGLASTVIKNKYV